MRMHGAKSEAAWHFILQVEDAELQRSEKIFLNMLNLCPNAGTERPPSVKACCSLE